MKDAERLLNSLTGVVSARMVTGSSGDIEEIHVLTTQDVSAKQTVRNVESALLAQLGINVDHRKISVAQTSTEVAAGTNGQHAQGTDVQLGETRVLFLGHEVENENPHRLRARVKIEWRGERILGEAVGTNLPRSRLDILANAVLHGLEAILHPEDDSSDGGAALALEGVKVVDAFDHSYVLVGVHAIHGRHVKRLSGAAPYDDVIERSVILATLQATDRWVRGRL